MLGATPVVGRTIEPDDDVAGRDDVAVLGFGLWQRLFGGDRAIVGKPLIGPSRRRSFSPQPACNAGNPDEVSLAVGI